MENVASSNARACFPRRPLFLQTASKLNMDIRLLIVGHPTNIYQAFVLAPENARSWIKTYESKIECMTDLRCIDLLTPEVADEALANDFDVMDRILILPSDTDPVTLKDAGFTEKTPELVN
jgi:hypothetical protein